MTDPPGSKKATIHKHPTLASGKKHTWERGKHKWLAIYWDDPISHVKHVKHAGSGHAHAHATVTLKAEAGEEASQTQYSVPSVGIPIKKRAGSLEHNTDETIRFVLT
jgi:hypothetical protein